MAAAHSASHPTAMPESGRALSRRIGEKSVKNSSQQYLMRPFADLSAQNRTVLGAPVKEKNVAVAFLRYRTLVFSSCSL